MFTLGAVSFSAYFRIDQGDGLRILTQYSPNGRFGSIRSALLARVAQSQQLIPLVAGVVGVEPPCPSRTPNDAPRCISLEGNAGWSPVGREMAAIRGQ